MGKRIKWNKDLFIEFCNLVHDDKYSYKNLEYVDMNSYAYITCPEHGDFKQNTGKHRWGRGCPKCANESRVAKSKWSFSEFVDRAREVHGDNYDYIEGTYRGYNKPVGVVCQVHGEFWPTVNNHLRGKICKACHLEGRTFSFASCAEDFQEKSERIHGDKYLYESVEYVNNKVPVSIWCKEHQESFSQRPDNHLMGREGCPHCLSGKNSGWVADIYRTNEESSLYLIKLEDKLTGEKFLKVGLSTNPRARWLQLQRTSPYHCTEIETFTGPAKGLLKCETNVIVDNRDHKHIPKTDFKGMTECFKMESLGDVQNSIQQHLPRRPK